MIHNIERIFVGAAVLAGLLALGMVVVPRVDNWYTKHEEKIGIAIGLLALTIVFLFVCWLIGGLLV